MALRTGIVHGCAAAVVLAGPLAAQSISVNFGANHNASTVTEAAKNTGAVPVAGNRWNNTTTAAGTLGSLLDSTGATTVGSVSWTSQNTWESASTGATVTSENGDLTKGYLDDSGSGWTVDLVSPYLLNDIYIIHSTDQGSPATMSAVRVNGTFYKGNGAGGTVTATASESWSAVNWTNANTLTESSHYIKVLGQPAVSLAGLNASPGRSAIAGLQVVNAYAGTLAYWDVNGATAGSGDSGVGTLNGTWGSSNFWSSSSAGDTATTGWTAGSAAVFSAGSDGTSMHDITISGTQSADAVWLQEGNLLLTGGVLDLTGGLGLVRADGTAPLYIASQVNAGNFTTAGSIYLRHASNAITGLVTVKSGTTTLEASHTWAQIAGGGAIDLFDGKTLTIGSTGLSSTFNGGITGNGNIVKNGSGSLTLGGSADEGGSLAINGGSVIFDTRINGTVALSRIISGTGGLQFVGAGASDTSNVSVTSDNSGFSGQVTINGTRVNVTLGNVLGTGPVSVLAGGQLWPSGGVITSNNLTLTGLGPTEGAGQLGALRIEGNATVSGNITLQGQTRLTTWNGTTGSITGTIAGDASSILEKTGSGTLTIESANNTGFLGKTRVDGSGGNGTLQIASQTTLGTTPASPTLDAITLLNGGLIQGGTAAAAANLTLDANRGIALPSGNGGFNTAAGFTTTVNGPITGSGSLTFAAGTGSTVLNGIVNVNGAVNVNAGSATFNSATVSAGSLVGNVGTTNLAAASATFANMNLGAGTNNAHTVNHTSGNVTSIAQVLVGHWGGNTSVYNISGGSLNLPDTVTSPTAENQANLFLGIDGTGVLNISANGVVNTSSLVVNGRSEGHNTDGAAPQADTLNLTGGRLNLGKWGMLTSGTSYAVNLGDGMLGASADWSSSLNMALTGNTVINTLDSANGTTPRTITLTGVLSGTGGFDKQGAGTLLLNQAAGTFTGTAKVSGGDLNVISGATAAAGIQVAPGGTLRVGSIASPGTATAASLDLNGGTAAFRIGSNGDLLTATNLNISAPSTLTVTPSSAITGPFPATFPVIDYTNLTGSLTNVTLVPANPHLSGTLVNDTVNTQIGVQITAADSLVWKGNVNGNWNVNTTANWVLASNGSTPSNFYGFDVVAFNDSGLSQSTVTLAGTIQPASTAVSNTTGTYTFQGTGLTAGSLTKSGAGSLVLLNNNTYTGTTTITGGSVTVGNGGTTGSLGGGGSVTLSDATLTFNRSDVVTLGRSVTGSGTGTIVKNGSGILSLGADANNANITVNAGTFQAVNGGWANSYFSAANRQITVNNGGTLTTSVHSLGGLGGGFNRPDITLNAGGLWQLNGEQYMDAGDLFLNGGTIQSVSSDLRLQGGTLTVSATAGGSSITGNAVSLHAVPVFQVADGAAAADFTISAPIGQSGTQGFTKTGAGTMVLTGANTYSGVTTISAGTLQVGNGSTSGTLGTSSITNNATLVINRSDSLAVSGVIGGTGQLVKSGAGVLSLAAANTYTGNTVINAGTVQLADNAQLKFAPGANGVSNKITGTGSLELLGDFVVDLTDANLTNGNSWTLVDVGTLSETYLSTFSLVGFTENANVHQRVDGDKTWTFTESTGVLTLSIGSNGYSDFENTHGIAGAGPEADSDGDGIDNGIEFVIGGNPAPGSAADLNKLPQILKSGDVGYEANYLTFVYNRTDASAAYDPYVQYSTSLAAASWTEAQGGVNGVVIVESNLTNPDTVTVKIPRTLAVGGKLFTRLRVDITP